MSMACKRYVFSNRDTNNFPFEVFFALYLKFLPSYVWPNCQFLGVTCHEVEYLSSLALTRKDSDSPCKIALVFQVAPQSRSICVHLSLSSPFT